MRRPNWLRSKQVALFVAVAALVAVVGVVVGREAGLGERAAVAEGEPLTLTLGPSQQICETTRGYQDSTAYFEKDEEGNTVQRSRVRGWSGIPSVPVAWRVSGGEAPYSLVIDNESAYRDTRYAGASGTATGGCADTSVGTSFNFDERPYAVDHPESERLYAVDPQVDSGWKTIRAAVTDANGDTAEATARVYVILNDPLIMKRGETYRVFDTLITAPSTHDLEVLGLGPDYECAANRPPSERCEDEIVLELLGIAGTARLFLYLSDGVESQRFHVLRDGTRIEGRFDGAAGSEGQLDVDRAFDLVSASVGDLPALDDN